MQPIWHITVSQTITLQGLFRFCLSVQFHKYQYNAADIMVKGGIPDVNHPTNLSSHF